MGQPGTKAARLAAASTDLPAVQPAAQRGAPYARVEEEYRRTIDLGRRRRYGQFFTPEPAAELMARWVLQCGPSGVLDPAVGVGVFPSMLRRLGYRGALTALDIDSQILDFATRVNGAARTRFIDADFLLWDSVECFDAVIANPPYLRHHAFAYEHDIFRLIGGRSGVRLSRLSNIYALFVLEACRRLAAGGRAAFIIPTEWTNANFGAALKQFLLGGGLLRHFVYFTHECLPFEDALTTACVLLVEKPRAASPLAAVSTHYLSDSGAVSLVWDSLSGKPVPGVIRKVFEPEKLLTEPKWDFLLREEVHAAPCGFVPLGELAHTKRGITTGANFFFHLSEQQVAGAGITAPHIKPCVGRSADVRGLVFTEHDLARLRREGKRCYLLSTGGKTDKAVESYLGQGEALGLRKRYVLANREPWYAMEKREPAPLWAAVFGRHGLRTIRNRTDALNLTTFHCIYPHDRRPDYLDALALCLNSPAVRERARMRHRVYGGGLMKVEPGDLLQIDVPDLRLAGAAQLRRMAALFRRLCEATGDGLEAPESLLKEIDAAVVNAARTK